MCDPLDYYCFKPGPYDTGIIDFYTQNTGIPGSLKRPAPLMKPQAQFTGTANLRALFGRTEFLPYASERYRKLEGAKALLGDSINEWNIMEKPTFPEPPYHAGFVDAPHAAYSSVQRVEKNCGCGGPESSKAKEQTQPFSRSANY